MRWENQLLDADGAFSVNNPAAQALPGLEATNFVRSVCTPDFAGITFHEVLCRTALNAVPVSSAMPFHWTINPMRGCTHACTYCFARSTHEYLDLNPGKDFDSQIIVKTNLVPVLRRELRKSTWKKEPVAMGTNTDPYQRAEGRYALMPGIIHELADSGTPFSILTKGTLLRRDLPLLRDAARKVTVHLSVSIAMVDEHLQQSLEPGTPSPIARMSLIRAIREAGFTCSVMAAPILPGLTDSSDQLDQLVHDLVEAGATSISAFALHLRPGAKQWFMQWLEGEKPELVLRYQKLYGQSSYVNPAYRSWLSQRMNTLIRKYLGKQAPSRLAERQKISSPTFRMPSTHPDTLF